ncbi:PAP2 family protein [Cooperia oncophora]
MKKFEAPIADKFSFPSGHTSRAAMLATLWFVLLSAFFPKYRFAAMLMALVVATSRVAMGRHYLSDALGGLLIGWLEGLAVLALPRGFATWIRQILH